MRPPTLVLLLFSLLVAAGPAVADEAPSDPVEQALAAPPATGLLVVEVVADSQAARVGIRPGDVIVRYDHSPTDGIDALRTAARAAEGKPAVVLEIVRLGGTRHTFEIAPGPIGVNLAAVKEGEGRAPLPPPTDLRLDFSPLKGAGHDDWYAFHLPGLDGKRGFEHAVVRLEDGNIVLRREVAFDGGEAWGLNHFDVTIVVKAETPPRLVSWRFEVPTTGFVAEGRVEEGGEASTLHFSTRAPGGEVGAQLEGPLPDDLPVVPSYLVETLAVLLPRTAGTSYHFRALTEGSGEVGRRPSALVVVGEEEGGAGEAAAKVWRIEQRRALRGTTTTFWVDARGRVVRADYGGARTRAATKAEALAGLHEGLRPRTAE